ncbi:MAG: hypothetical protein WAP47_16430 [Candidatus Rokuibacteriota bacterium]
MNAKLIALLLVGVLVVLPPVTVGAGTLELMRTTELAGEWGDPLADNELAGVRGGFNGMAFSVFFTGTIDSQGVQGVLSTDTSGVLLGSSPSISLGNGQVNIQTSIGSFNGFQGILQVTQLAGAQFNVVNNNLFVQIAIINVLNGASVPSLATLLGPVR